MNISDFKNKTARWNRLKSVDLLGSFDFHTLIVTLDSLSQQQLDAADDKAEYLLASYESGHAPALDMGGYEVVSKVCPLVAHEFTHFLDSTSTLWGLRHLKMMADAYGCSDKYQKDENQFYKAKIFYDHSRMIKFPDYYTIVAKGDSGKRPWIQQLTQGIVFDSDGRPTDRSVVFSWFGNSKGEALARSPISPVSLLECSAMAQELMNCYGLIQQLKGDEKIVEQKSFEKRCLDYLYDNQFTEYSVCVHIVANHLGCKDILVAFRICSIIVRVLFNLPDRCYDEIASHWRFKDSRYYSATDSKFTDRLIDGVRGRNMGSVFLIICEQLALEGVPASVIGDQHVRNALRKIGANTEGLFRKICEEADGLIKDIQEININPISVIAEAGLFNLRKVGLAGGVIKFFDLYTPPALSADSTPWLAFKNPANKLSTLDLDDCFLHLYEGQSWVERFSESCV